jgi:hypothetical protein
MQGADFGMGDVRTEVRAESCRFSFCMKRWFLGGLIFAVCFPLCFLIVSFAGDQLAAMTLLSANQAHPWFWSLLISLIISWGVARQRSRVRRKGRACKSVNCFSLHFRA